MNMHVTKKFKLHAVLMLIRRIGRYLRDRFISLPGINLHLAFRSSAKKEPIFSLIKQLIIIELLEEKLYFYNYTNV